MFYFKESQSTIVKFNGKESILFGNFGKIIHRLEVGDREFLIDRIGFKFPAEHKVQGLVYDSEMQIYMKSKDV